MNKVKEHVYENGIGVLPSKQMIISVMAAAAVNLAAMLAGCAAAMGNDDPAAAAAIIGIIAFVAGALVCGVLSSIICGGSIPAAIISCAGYLLLHLAAAIVCSAAGVTAAADGEAAMAVTARITFYLTAALASAVGILLVTLRSRKGRRPSKRRRREELDRKLRKLEGRGL